MAGESGPKTERASVAVTPRELRRIKQAARVLGARTKIEVTVSDILRQGALARADEILIPSPEQAA